LVGRMAVPELVGRMAVPELVGSDYLERDEREIST
jgi:hypothetical protein